MAKLKWDVEAEEKSWDLAKRAAYCPSPNQARRMLGVTAEQFSKLMAVSIRTVWRWESGAIEPSIHQKILIKEILITAEKKGLIAGPRR